MDIHKPKPIHSLKEFLGEIGVIVIGVLIALGGEQAVEALHWRHQVEAAHEALASDFEGLVAVATEREYMSGCIGRRLDMLAATLEEAQHTGRLPPLGVIGNPTDRTWQTNSWTALVASQVATHMPRTELNGVSGLQASALNAAGFNKDETAQWEILYTMIGPGRLIDPAEQATLRQALVRARMDAKQLRLQATQLDAQVKRIGLVTPARHDEVQQTAAAFARAQDSLCGPVGPVPALYGLATPSRVDLIGPIRQFPLRKFAPGSR